MRSPAEIEALARELLPPSHVDRGVRSVTPAWFLDPDDRGPVRVGGPALLAGGEAWPRNARGIPLTFLAALPLEDLPAVPAPWAGLVTWPHAGETLRVFADLVANPHEPGRALVLPVGGDVALREVEAPPVPDPWPVKAVRDEERDSDDLDADERVRELPGVRASFVLGLTPDEFAFGRGAWDTPEHEAIEGFAEQVWEFPEGEGGVAKVLGGPYWTMFDPRDEDLDPEAQEGSPDDPVAERRILLELHSGFGPLEILDGGAYVVAVPTESLGTTYGPATCHVGSC